MTDEAPAAAPIMSQPPPTPPGLTPYITIRAGRGEEAMAWYVKALGGTEVFRNVAPDGKRLLHARVAINGQIVMFSDDFPDWRGGSETPAPAAVTLHLQVDDADAWAGRAAEAGAEITQPVSDAFWGDRYGAFRDPFGHSWSVGSTKKT